MIHRHLTSGFTHEAMADTAELITDADGWTLRSATGCRTAHSEHTIAITSDGAEILTLPKPAHS